MGALDSTIVLLAFPAITDGLHSDFITGIDAALYASIAILAIAAVLSATRGKETRTEPPN